MSSSQADFFSRSGAETLAARIRKYWLQQGKIVETRIERCRPRPGKEPNDGPYFVVRTNTLNGWPK